MKKYTLTIALLVVSIGVEAQTKNIDSVLLPYRGSVVYVDFWASWCVHCLDEMGTHEQWLQQHYASKKVKFVFISMDRPEDTAKAKEIIRSRHISGVQLFWGSGQMKDIYFKPPEYLPTYMLFDRDGKLFNADAKTPSQTPGIYLQIDSLLHPTPDTTKHQYRLTTN